ncbi:hypothetical protein QQF64_005108 [Cirrhinus molitorella]|uniref:Uncharacterized protein n=2 Tax=Cirrhinus molitorella TaxID=172907 RepID=A0ABR3MKQ2_9TELE|nr:hypothetical protein Q8A67_020213 [Cirrhinus molitorella]
MNSVMFPLTPCDTDFKKHSLQLTASESRSHTARHDPPGPSVPVKTACSDGIEDLWKDVELDSGCTVATIHLTGCSSARRPHQRT